MKRFNGLLVIILIFGLFYFVCINSVAADPLIILVIDADPSVHTARIAWLTDVASDSMVVYDLQFRANWEDYAFQSPLDTDMVLNHEVILSGLDPEQTYHYRVLSKDTSDNLVVSGDEQFTTLPLDSSIFIQLPIWTNTDVFTLSWEPGIGVLCTNVVWKRTDVDVDVSGDDPDNPVDGWENISYYGDSCLPSGLTSIVFGDGGDNDPGVLVDDQTYHFGIRSQYDDESWQPWDLSDVARYTNTSIDRNDPSITLEARDQDGGLFEDVNLSEGVTQIDITTTASDIISDLKTNKILYYLTIEGLEFTEQRKRDCGSSGTCNVVVDFDSSAIIKYQGYSEDNAGNIKETGWSWVTPHTLANFVTHHLNLEIGSIYNAKLQVRNLQDSQDTVTVDFGTSYELAKFISGEGSYEIKNNGRTVDVTLEPDEQRTFIVSILPSDVGQYQLELTATSSLGILTDDIDTMTINITYPAGFSGLSEWAVVLLLITAICVYSVWFSNKKPR